MPNFNFELLKNIKQFPDNSVFKHIGVDINNEDEMYKNYINSQKIFYNKDSIRFLKTHSCFVNKEGFRFTDGHNTLGVIYIVRDPRTVAISYSNHKNTSIDKITDKMINGWYTGGVLNSERSSSQTVTYISSWEKNYNSWKSFDAVNKYLLIKYEDIVSEKKEEIFIKRLDFVHQLDKKKFTLNKNKLKNVLETTRFEQVQSLEPHHGFYEAWKNDFFYKGPNNDWKKTLDFKNQQKIEKSFSKEMKELEYI